MIRFQVVHVIVIGELPRPLDKLVSHAAQFLHLICGQDLFHSQVTLAPVKIDLICSDHG